MGNYFKPNKQKQIHQTLRDQEVDVEKFFQPFKCIAKRYNFGVEIYDDQIFLPKQFLISFNKKQLFETQKLFYFLYNKYNHKGSIVITGYFGSGKTTLVNKIEQFILKNMKYTKIPLIPIYINLQQIGNFNFINFRQILTNKPYSFNLHQIKQFELDLAQGKFNILAIIDCYEKLLLKNNGQKKQKLLQQSFQFQQMYLTIYVVTTEVIDDKSGAEWFNNQPNVLTIQLQSFEQNEALEFFYKYKQFDLRNEISKFFRPVFQEIFFFTKDCENEWNKIIMKDYEDIENELYDFEFKLIDEIQWTFYKISGDMLQCIDDTISNHLQRILQVKQFLEFLKKFGFHLSKLTPFFMLQIISFLDKEANLCSFSINNYLNQLTQEIFFRKLNNNLDEQHQNQILQNFQIELAFSQNREQKTNQINFATKINYLIFQNLIKYQKLILDFFIATQIESTVDQLPLFKTYEEILLNINSELYDILKNSSFLGIIDFSLDNSWIVQFLKEMFEQNEQFQRKLINIIQASSVINHFEKVASNAIMILKQLKSIYYGENFSGIRIKDCSLNGMFFHQCNFKNSIMENVNISQCWFKDCCLDEVNWQKMQSCLLFKQNFFGEEDYVGKLCTFTPNGKNLFMVGSNCAQALSYSLESGKIKRILSNVNNIIDRWEFFNDELIFITDLYCRIRLIHIEMNKLVKQFYPQNKQISQIKLSPNKEILACGGSGDRKIKLWDVRNKKILRIFIGFLKPVQSFSFTLDSKLLASSALEHTVRIWEIFSGIQLPQLDGHSYQIRDAVFSQNGKILTSCGGDGIKMWNYREQNEIREIKEKVSTLAFTSNDKILISGGQNEKIIFWDIESGQKTKEMIGHNLQIEKIATSSDGKFLASFCREDRICVWDVQTIINMQQVNFYHPTILQLEFSYDDSILALTSKNQITFWNLKSGILMKVIYNKQETYQIIKFMPSDLLLAYCHGKNLFILDPFKGTKIELLRKSRSHIISIDFSVNGEIIFLGCYGHQIDLIFKNNGKLLKRIIYGNEQLSLVKISSKDKIFADFYYCNCMWNIQTVKLIRKMKKFQQQQHFEANNEIIAQSDKSNIYFLDVKTSYLLDTLNFNYLNRINLIHLSSQLKIMVSYSLNAIQIWDLSRQLILKTFVKNFVYNVSAKISPKGTLLVLCCNDETVEIWKIAKEKNKETNLNQSDNIFVTAFSKQNSIFASAYFSKSITLWDIENRKKITKLKAHKNIITQLCYSQSGNQLLSCCQNHEIYMWQPKNKYIKLIGKFLGNESSIVSLAISADESTVASANLDNLIFIWKVEGGRLTNRIKTHDRIKEISFSDDNFLISLSKDSVIQKWNIEEQQPQGLVLFENTEIIVASQFLPKCKLLAFVNSQNTISIMNLTNFQIKYCIKGPNQKIQSIAFSENGDQLGWQCEDQFIYLWSVEEQVLKVKLECSMQIFKQFQILSNYQIGYCKQNGVVSIHDIISNKVYDFQDLFLKPLCVFSNNIPFYSKKISTFNANIRNWQNLNLVNIFGKA